MRRDVRAFVVSCQTCQQMKVSNRSSAGLLQPLPIANVVFEEIAMDFITSLPSSKGKATILTVVDRLSKYGHFIPLSATFTAYSVAVAFVAHVIKLHGLTPFQVLYGREPPSVSRYILGTATDDLVEKYMLRRDEVLTVLKENLHRAQIRMKTYADAHRTDLQPEVGDWAFVKLKPYRQLSLRLRNCHKLGKRYFGPYRVVKRIGSVAYKLDLPADVRIHPVFHISMLKKCVGTPAEQVTPLIPTSTEEQLPPNLEDKVLIGRKKITTFLIAMGERRIEIEEL
ncbi:PREDICTED: uncharacterized protein LOC109238210 [Nicotiana attenuata]|uniref:uncharacterized protein LOC109238210 n=1 Tax=Nicotiana attenuata TaxID=49451 RepID=UPI0009051387|nr:PREDICTED: uncharacterized protein LOC109238210 [Nicotiana attenuata]